MDVTVGLFLTLLVLAFFCEWIDASLGMGYGTILSPTLILMGFDPIVSVPAVLLSQAFGGFTASVFHHRFENVRFERRSPDLQMVSIVVGFGVLATVFAALLSLRLPKIALETYIGTLVAAMGVILLARRKFSFSWRRMVWVGILSAFNKGISGGGFGPVVTGGQILSGQKHRNAVGVTTLAEAPICITGFFTYLIARTAREMGGDVFQQPFDEFVGVMFSPRLFQWELLLALLLGSVLVAPFGALTTRALPTRWLHLILGAMILTLGVMTLVKAWT